MKEFFKMMFASTLGVFIAGSILFIFSFIVLVGMIASLSSSPAYTVKDNSVLQIGLSGTINERENNNPLDLFWGATLKNPQGLNDIITSIEKAKDNDKIKGIFITSSYLNTGFATLNPIREALLKFKESGKFIVAYADNFSQNAYYVSSVADKIFMNPQGIFDFRGLSSSQQYNKGVFQKWGIDIQVFKVGTYKSAVEPYVDDKMSNANREQTASYLNSIWNNLLAGISESRSISTEQLNRYADECLTFMPTEKIVEYGLVDELKYQTEAEDYLKELVGIDQGDQLAIAKINDLKSIPSYENDKKEKIAILYAEGQIMDDELANLYSHGNVITPGQYIKELRKLQEDDDVKAVVFRINSPGGSAFASEQIWHAVKEFKASKPIIVSMGDYAASGGYYIACEGNKIVAEPTTLTGSIGIFGMVPNGAELAKKMGATHDGVSTNKHAAFGSETLSIPFTGIGLLPARALNTEECALVQAHVERGYDLFLKRCADGRGMSKEEINVIGQGRVWTGNQALELGLIDELGGLEKAIQLAAELANIENYSLSEYPAPKDFFSDLFYESMNGIKARFIQGIMGTEQYHQKVMLEAWRNYDFQQAIALEFMKY